MFGRLRSNSKSSPASEKKGGSNDSVNDEIGERAAMGRAWD